MQILSRFLATFVTSSGTNLIYSLVIILLGVAAKISSRRLIAWLISRVEDDDPKTINAREQRAYTLGGVMNNLVNLIIWGTAIVTLMAQWGINIAPILAGAGVLGLAVGFGAQTLVKDVVTGFIVLLENSYNVGDKVIIAKVEGKIKQINLRTTILEDEQGTTYIIPNSKIDIVSKHDPKKSANKK